MTNKPTIQTKDLNNIQKKLICWLANGGFTRGVWSNDDTSFTLYRFTTRRTIKQHLWLPLVKADLIRGFELTKKGHAMSKVIQEDADLDNIPDTGEKE